MNTIIHIHFDHVYPNNPYQITHFLKQFNQYTPMNIFKEMPENDMQGKPTVTLTAELDPEFMLIDFLIETFKQLSIAVNNDIVKTTIDVGNIVLSGQQMLEDKIRHFTINSQIMTTNAIPTYSKTALYTSFPFSIRESKKKYLNTQVMSLTTEPIEDTMVAMYEDLDSFLQIPELKALD